MATVATMEIISDKPKRTRKTHHKVRTGCQTCKIRRKKCDEEKPFCRRCTSTGRTCDGYAPLDQPDQTSTESSPGSYLEGASKRQKLNNRVAIQRHRPSPSSSESGGNMDQLWRAPSTVSFDDDAGFYCFDFFRHRTGPEFSAYFDSSIWRTYILRASLQHPTVLAAATAVGAVHRRFELGISREAFEYCDISQRLYQKAVKMLNQEMSLGKSNSNEINMLTRKLFSMFEVFQGNYDAALSNMSQGIKALLNQTFRTTYTDTQYRSVDINYESLRKLFLKLELESVRLFNGAYKILRDPDEIVPIVEDKPLQLLSPRSPIDVPDAEAYPIPRAFASLAEARNVLFTEAKWIWHTWNLLERGMLSGTGFQRHQVHISRLLQWSMAYAEFSKTEFDTRDARARHAAHLLKAYREASYLVLLTQMAFHEPGTGAKIIPLCDPPETCDCHRSCRTYAERKEALNAHFARLLVLAESIFNASSFFTYDQHSLSMDSGIGPPIYMGATKCRSTKVRHQVTSLLENSEIQTRVWDALGVYSIAEKLSSIEEHAVVGSGAVPASLEPKWVDITFFLEEKRVLLRYCTPDKEGVGGKMRGTGLTVPMDEIYSGNGSGSGGLVWTQQWISF